MIDEETIWDNITRTFSPGRIKDFSRVVDVEAKQGDFIPAIRQVDELVRQGYGFCLPDEFFLDLNARTLRKYLRTLKWRRMKSKKQAMEKRITPFYLMNESRGKISEGIYYGRTGWRGLSVPENKEFFLYSWIEGWLLGLKGRDLFRVRRYDKPEDLEQMDDVERARISREISKITESRIDFKEEIMRRGGIRTGQTPSRSTRDLIYKDMRQDGLPVRFKQSSSNLCHATWFDFTSHYHNCPDKKEWITYLGPRTELICAHDIAFSTVNFLNDFRYKTDPYMVFPVFPRPSQEWFESYWGYRKNGFKRVGNRRQPLGKLDIEGLLFCHEKNTNAKFF